MENETDGGRVEVKGLCTSLRAAHGEKNAVCLQEMARVYGL